MLATPPEVSYYARCEFFRIMPLPRPKTPVPAVTATSTSNRAAEVRPPLPLLVLFFLRVPSTEELTGSKFGCMSRLGLPRPLRPNFPTLQEFDPQKCGFSVAGAGPLAGIVHNPLGTRTTPQELAAF